MARPNLAFSPPLVAHLPAPFESRRTRKPIYGSTFIWAETFENMRQLLELLDDQNNGFCQAFVQAEPLRTKVSVLVAVADDQAFMILMKGQGRHEFRLAPRLDDRSAKRFPASRISSTTSRKLVHFDRKDTTIDIAVAHGLDRIGKGLVDRSRHDRATRS